MIGLLEIITEDRDVTVYQETTLLIAFVWGNYDDKGPNILMVPCCCRLCLANQYRETNDYITEFLFCGQTVIYWLIPDSSWMALVQIHFLIETNVFKKRENLQDFRGDRKCFSYSSDFIQA